MLEDMRSPMTPAAGPTATVNCGFHGADGTCDGAEDAGHHCGQDCNCADGCDPDAAENGWWRVRFAYASADDLDDTALGVASLFRAAFPAFTLSAGKTFLLPALTLLS